MNALKENKRNTLHVAVTAEAREILQKLADENSKAGAKVYPSDIARTAIEQYLKGLGYEIEIKVNRGGRRDRADKEEAE